MTGWKGVVVLIANAVTAILLITIAVIALSSCAIPLEVEVDVGLRFDDRCLLLFPECGRTPGVPYRCVDSGGTPDYDCVVACLAARSLTCEADGPVCTQRLGDEEHWVPVVCVERNPS